MILDALPNLAQHEDVFGGAIYRCLTLINRLDFSVMEYGRFELMKGVTATFKMNRPVERREARSEAHRRFIDIQYIVSGRERMEWSPLTPDIPVTQDASDESDTVFYADPQCVVPFELTQGMFAVFHPGDVHRPNVYCGFDEVEKLVVKVPTDL